MEIAGSLASILAVLIVGVMSPGPSFLLVAQTAVGQSRRAAMASAQVRMQALETLLDEDKQLSDAIAGYFLWQRRAVQLL